MFIPKLFQVTDFEEIRGFVEAHAFGSIVTVHEGRPVATHLPFQFRRIGGEWTVTGHFAKANPQWTTIGGQEALVMIQGPHAYVSSSWYTHENVSTWNYQAVHLYGVARLMDEKELEEELSLLMRKYEHHRENPVLWETLSEQTKMQKNAVVGFTIRINEIQAAYKLSQNRNNADYRNIIDGLRGEGNPDSERMAALMETKRSE
ncbi:FMN-binding negative transcriptional regulator [Bhargavaea beijingensis]|uniref:FMN-binding negative transcriptional regulator n=1 Tax=Bhargavaea beijingensis TaxID=426756 RepID=A0A1G7GNI5_9BACL|nr:FMN-binding negative transcriptional regulator [Bhargavaea beijingensis]MCW1929635.1 FMN-binding negative transcriptional regulator [Bhargavaea beijingensis]RSK24125.1 FMN-binding negative transcriptional regulator [Bhargavaea beijingensis]SDE89715.1 negative transcriptional regulator, PaiB family [Bhargavaea beijingensis]